MPESWNNADANVMLQKLGLSLEALIAISNDELNQYLGRYHFDWANMELFADMLCQLSAKADFEVLKPKAIALYHFIQQESKIFSFEIMGKISKLQ